MDKQELKSLALLERVGELTRSYEDRIADLRVALTEVTNERDELQSALTELRESEGSYKAPDFFGSEVVEETE